MPERRSTVSRFTCHASHHLLLLLAVVLGAASPRLRAQDTLPPPADRSAPADSASPVDSAALADSLLRAELVRAVDAELASPLFARTLAAVEISDAESGAVLYERHADLLLRPASCAKLFTLAAALLELPDTAEFRSEVLAAPASGPARELWLRGGGDPLLAVEDIQNLARRIQAAGIARISALRADCSLYDTLEWGRGWMWDDAADPSMPAIAPLTVNGGRIDVTVTPGRGRQRRPAVTVVPALPSIAVDAHVALRRRGELRVVRDPSSNRIRVDGAVAPGEPATESVAMRDPAQVTAALLLASCRELGIAAPAAPASPAAAPTEAAMVARVTRPLAPVLYAAGRRSDNLCAEALLRMLAARDGRRGVSARDGLTVARRALALRGIDSGEVQLVDGSGVSFYNLVTARATGRLLRMMRAQACFSAYAASLARPDERGTLARRLPRVPGAAYVRAKTGTISGVSTLAGYVLPPGGRQLAFVLYMENFPGSPTPYRAAQDRILARCIAYATKSGGPTGPPLPSPAPWAPIPTTPR